MKGRLKANADEYETSLQLTKTANSEFEAVKQARCDAFFEAFAHIQGRIDDIYKACCASIPTASLTTYAQALTKSDSHEGGYAYLSLENSEVRTCSLILC